MVDISNDKWINIDEAAEYLGVKPGTIRDWIRKEKGIPHTSCFYYTAVNYAFCRYSLLYHPQRIL